MPHPAPRSILLIRPSALGDVCRSVPVLASLRAAWPEARIDWLVQEEFSEVISAHPALDSVVSFPRARFRGAWRSPARTRDAISWAMGLRKGGWDLAIDCQGLARSALFSRLTGASRRIGFADARELGWIHYTTTVTPEEIHAVDRMMSLVDALELPRVMDMRLYPPVEASEWWGRSGSRPDGGYLVFAPRSRWPSKEWPQKRWCELALRCRELGIEDIVLVGSPSEATSIERLADLIGASGADAPRMHVLAGRTTVGQLMAVIERSVMVVGSDSAALHMAVGLDRPLVALFGPTDPSEVGPYGRGDRVVRVPDASGRGHDYRSGDQPAPSMQAIDVEMVLEAMATGMGGAS